jgi:hypothetical protein
MARDNKPHDWNKEQPHDVKTDRIRSDDYARNHPDRVEWVKGKN